MTINSSGEVLRVMMGGGGFYLAFFLTLFFLYHAMRDIYLYVRFSTPNSPRPYYLKSLFLTFVTFIVACIIMFLLGYIVGLVNLSTNSEEVFNTSLKLISLEDKIFGFQPALWFHSTDNLSKPFWDSVSFILVWVYRSLGVVMAFAWLFVTYRNSMILSKLTLSWILTTIFSAPIWYLVPAISPQEIFIDNSLNIALPDHLKQVLDHFDPTSATRIAIDFHNKVWNSNQNGSFAITTFPSMHVAWATILMYYMAKTNKYLSVFFVPYWILTCISTVYTLQHYTIDVPAGIFVTAVCIFVSERYVRKEPAVIRRLSRVFRNDINNVWRWGERRTANILNNTLYKSKFFRVGD